METPDANSQFFLTAGNTDEPTPDFRDKDTDPMTFTSDKEE
jgi:hypothetical protein